MSDAPPSGTPSLSRTLGRTVLALGLVSLLTDASSDMIWPLLPVFLVEQLHRSVAFLGVIEGIADATAAVGKYFAGKYSDRVAQKKPVVVAGYGLSSLMRPMLSLATSPWQALAVRFVDRVGKGVRTSPRDALLAAAAPPERRALAFGFHRAMDNMGAVIGPLLAAIVLSYRPNNLRLVFALSAIPGALALLALATLVRESPVSATPARVEHAAVDGARDGRFRGYVAIVTLFTLADASDFFLIAKARDVGLPLRAVPLLWGGLSLLRALAATPGGLIADRIGRARALSIGWAVYAAAYAGLAFSRTPFGVVAWVAVYGVYYGLTEGAARALVATFAPRDALGRAYGTYALWTGLAAIPASLVFGALYGFGSGRTAFLTSAALALLASVAMEVWSRTTVRDRARS